MGDQSSLGGRQIYRLPKFDQITVARVTSVKDYEKFGRIEVVGLDNSQPVPIWVIGDIDREPVEGDQILMGYIEGRQDAPYMKGYVKNKSYGTNFIVMKKDKIKLQLPVFEVGVIGGASHKDTQGNLLDDANQEQRAYIELAVDHALISFPTDIDGATPPAFIKVTADGVEINHPTGVIKHNSGTTGVARQGDTVQVTVSGTDSRGDSFTATGTGTITSASTKTMID